MNITEALKHVDKIVEDKDVIALKVINDELNSVEKKLDELNRVRCEHRDTFVKSFERKLVNKCHDSVFLNHCAGDVYNTYLWPTKFLQEYNLKYNNLKNKRKTKKFLTNNVEYDTLFRKFHNLDKSIKVTWLSQNDDSLHYSLNNIIYTPPEETEELKTLKANQTLLREKRNKLEKHLFYNRRFSTILGVPIWGM